MPVRNCYDEPGTVGDRAIDSTLGEAGPHVIRAKGLNRSIGPVFFHEVKLAGESLQSDPRRSKTPPPSWTHFHRPCRFARGEEMLLNGGNDFDIEEYHSETGRLQPIDP